jgi:ElaB/YqjD/DUF883 family membrane-anchored ribosome-binding protein
MDKVAKLDLMEKIVRELEDLRNSQEAVLKKISQVEVNNMELNHKELEDKITTFYTETAEQLDSLTALHESFAEETERFQRDNNIVREEASL